MSKRELILHSWKKSVSDNWSAVSGKTPIRWFKVPSYPAAHVDFQLENDCWRYFPALLCLCGWKGVMGKMQRFVSTRKDMLVSQKHANVPKLEVTASIWKSKTSEREREDLSTRRATWQYSCGELAFQSKFLFWSMQSITRKSGLPSGSHLAHKARVSLHLLPRTLLLSYSAATQNAELFIQPDGKRVKKVSLSPGDYKRKRWDTWTPVPAPQSY